MNFRIIQSDGAKSCHKELGTIFALLGSKKNAYQKVEVTKDVNLGRYQFHKQLNAFEAYQQLENYVSTVFGMQVPKIIEVSNKEKIVKAGFDLTTSFRKEKES